MKPLEDVLKEYKPLFLSLLHRPFLRFEGGTKNTVKWSMLEEEEMFMFIEDSVIDLYYAYDSTKGVDFAGYMVMKLKYKVHHYAKKKIAERSCQTYDETFIEKQEGFDSTPDESIEKYEFLLTPRQFEVCSLYYTHQLKPSVIGEYLGIPRQNVYSHLRISEGKIKEYIAEQENPHEYE